MGQRLGIHIERKSDNKELANCYYHWSAYTVPALELANDIMSNLHTILDSEKDDTYRAIKLLQSTGAGLIDEDYDEIKDEDKSMFHISQDRNLGLISFTEANMNETDRYEESRLTIELDINNDNLSEILKPQTKVNFEVFTNISKEEVKEYFEDEIKSGELELSEIPTLDYDMTALKRDELMPLLRQFEYCQNNYMGLFRLKGSTELYQCIY
jgi:hypothetical protein